MPKDPYFANFAFRNTSAALWAAGIKYMLQMCICTALCCYRYHVDHIGKFTVTFNEIKLFKLLFLSTFVHRFSFLQSTIYLKRDVICSMFICVHASPNPLR